MTEHMPNTSVNKRYTKIKLTIAIIAMVLDIVLIALWAFSGLSGIVAEWISGLAIIVYLRFIIFMATLGISISIFGLPLDFFGSFVVEHRFGLSNQSFFRWVLEKLKATAVGSVIGIPLSLGFFYFLVASGEMWWLYFGILTVAVAVLLAKIAPIIIFPLFYKFKKLEQDAIAARIATLLETQKVQFEGIYSFNMSKDTKKANAGFAGFGKGKRIILSDTLITDFTPEEIGVIFAHELGHYKKKHVIRNLIVSSSIILLSFYLCGAMYKATLSSMGFPTVHEIAAIPILLFYLSIFGIIIMPLTNLLSRHHEHEADAFALEVTGNAPAFISAMERLAAMNLSDSDPHPLVEILFHSHPSIRKRIESAKDYSAL